MRTDPHTGEIFDDDTEEPTPQDTPATEPAAAPPAPPEMSLPVETMQPNAAAQVSAEAVAGIDTEKLIVKVAERQLTKKLAVVVDEVLDTLDFSSYTTTIKETALARLSGEGGQGVVEESAPSPADAGDNGDFLLSAAEVASMVSELSDKLTVSAFRSLVLKNEAPQPAVKDGRTALWYLSEIERWVSTLPPAPQESPAPVQPEDPAPESIYKDIYTFFSAELHPLYVRESNFLQEKDAEKRALAWCPQWWLHIEAVTRISALWHGWEKSRLEAGAAFSTWMLDHADRHMDRLLNSEGPFRYCSATGGHTRKAVPFIVEEFPESLTLSDAALYTADGELKSAPEGGRQ